jgi:hypothetical protein
MAGKRSESTKQKILKLTKWLSDRQAWNWTRMSPDEDAADRVLMRMAELGLIEHENHRLGGDIWIAGGQKFGRLD